MLPILSNSDKIWPQKNLKVPTVWRRHTDLRSWWNPFPDTRMNKLLADNTDEDRHFTSLSVCGYRSVTGLKPSGFLNDQRKWGWGLLSIHSMKSYFFTNSAALEPSRVVMDTSTCTISRTKRCTLRGQTQHRKPFMFLFLLVYLYKRLCT